MDRFRDISGVRFGTLVAESRISQSKNGTWKWSVACDCGQKEVVFITQLTSGMKVCCGTCRNEITRKQRTTHGMTKTREYQSWKAMKARCYNPEASHYDQYGGRGIKVCDQWKESFEQFLKDMGLRPVGTSLERIDCDGDYKPDNCKWATAKEQASNRRNNATIDFNGEVLTVAEWSRRAGISTSTLLWRMRQGWSPEKILGTANSETKITETVA